MQEAGFNAVATYVPWIVHEYEEGHFDFTGQRGDVSNLVAFLDLCRTLGMPIMLRPGPLIFAEYDGFGIPRWLGRKYPECVMRHANGTLVKGPYYFFYSLLHPTYLVKVEDWYQALVQLLWPAYGELVLSFQLDNETGMPFANTLGNFDFNNDTITRYRAFLHERYGGNDDRLRACWGTSSITLERAHPPMRPVTWAEATDWYEFFESLVVTYLQTLRDMAVRLGVPVPFVINDLDLSLSPGVPSKKRGIAAIQGYDIYTKGSGYPSTADYPFAPAHDPERFSALIDPGSTLLSVELGAGWFDPRARVSTQATVQATLGGIAHGMQGHSYYIAHDGHDPSGSPYAFGSFFDADGRPSHRLDAVASIHAWIREHEAQIVASQPIASDILYVAYQPYARLMPGEYLPGQLLPDPLLYLEKLGLDGWYDLLLTAGYAPRYVDLQHVTLEQLQAARVVCFPTRGWLDLDSLDKLTHYVEGGGHLITFPVPVSRDEYGRTLESARGLYPVAEHRHRHLGYGTVGRRIVTDLLGKYLLWDRWRLRRQQPTALYTADSFEGLKVLLNQQLPAARLTAPDGNQVRGDYMLTHFDVPPAQTGTASKAQAIAELLDGGRCAGYSVACGSGTSTVLGTFLAGSYTTGAFYQLRPAERTALRQYATTLMTRFGVRQLWWSALDLECTLRAHPSGSLFVYVFNRTGEQHGQIAFSPQLGPFRSVVSCWTHLGSSAILASADSLEVTLRTDDVLVVHVAHDGNGPSVA
jgi:hypothetical protein